MCSPSLCSLLFIGGLCLCVYKTRGQGGIGGSLQEFKEKNVL